MKKFCCTVIHAIAALTVSLTASATMLTPLSSFGPNGDGTIRPGDSGYSFITVGDGGSGITGNPYNRGMAYNPVTGHVLVVNHQKGNEGIYIIDGTTGAVLAQTLNLDSTVWDVNAGNTAFTLNCIGIGDDGAIYVANLSNSTSTNYPQTRLYRWADESAPQMRIFSGDPTGNIGSSDATNKRWGDTLAVRGSGTNTQILMASRGTQVAIFTPTDGALTNFVSTVINTDVPVGALGYGITFGAGDTFYGTAGANTRGPLYRLSFNLGAGTATTLQSYSSSVFPGNVTPIGVLVASNLLAGVEMLAGADLFRLYDISIPANPPVLLDHKYFVTTNNNSVDAGAIAFGGGNVYALDSENGLMAFTLTNGTANLEPTIFLQPAGTTTFAGSNYTFTAGVDGSTPLSLQWWLNGTNALANETNSTLTLTNLQDSNSGSYTIVASNAFGAVTSSVAVLVTFTPEIGSQLLYDPLNYTVGATLAGQGNWLLNNGTSGTIEAGSLSVPGLYPSSGNRFTWNASAMNVRINIGDVTNGVLYYSFALRIDNLGAESTDGLLSGFCQDTGTAYAPRVNIRTNGVGGYQLGTSKFNSGTKIWATNNFTTNDIVFIVARYTFLSGGAVTNDDVVSLWLNPDPAFFGASVPPTPTLTTSSGNDLLTLNRFNFRAGGSTQAPAKHVADEPRVGTTWASVTPPLPPALSVTHGTGTVTVAWPSNVTGFNLESTAVLPAGWTNVPSANNSATLDASSGQQYFRLKK